MAIGFSINVRSLGQRVLKCKAQQPAIEIAPTQTMSAEADCPSQPAIEIAPTQTMSASADWEI